MVVLPDSGRQASVLFSSPLVLLKEERMGAAREKGETERNKEEKGKKRRERRERGRRGESKDVSFI